VASIDVRRNWLGRPRVYSHASARCTSLEARALAQQVESLGAGEILLNSVDRDGCMSGFDIDTLRNVTSSVRIPVIACGGASSVDDLAAAVRLGGASAVAAGSLFVFQGRHRAVLIQFPTAGVLEQVFPERRCETTTRGANRAAA
jgi:cyclase